MNDQLKFPCDCISSTPTCDEPWARVAKEGMFKDGTKEVLLNKLHQTPQTIAQLSKTTGLAQPTVYRHVNELLQSGLIRRDEVADKSYVVERYYRLNFPVVAKEDSRKFSEEVEVLSANIQQLIRRQLPGLKEKYRDSKAAEEGWTFEEFAQYLVHLACRNARQQLEREGELADQLNSSNLDFLLWATEE